MVQNNSTEVAEGRGDEDVGDNPAHLYEEVLGKKPRGELHLCD
jgi:hypothetical protein